jgi:hypothetical protein
MRLQQARNVGRKRHAVMRDEGYFLGRLFLAISMTIAVHIAKRIVSAAIGAQIISKIPQFSNLTIGNDVDPCHVG